MSEVIEDTPASPSEAVTAGEQLASGAGAGEVAPVIEEAPVAAEPQVDVRELQAQVEYANERFDQLVQYIQQTQGGTQAQATAQASAATGFDPSDLTDEFGNFDPVAFARYQSQRDEKLFGSLRQEIAQIAQPLAARQEAEIYAEGEQRLSDILADDVARNGEFSTDADADKQARSLVRTLADQQFGEVAQRYGSTPRAAEIAMARAADQVRGLLKAAGDAAVTARANHNATLAGVRSEPAAGAAGLVTIPDGPQAPGSIARKYAVAAERLRTQP